MKQCARILGALPSGLVRPGEFFDWPTKCSWADEVSEEDAEAAKQMAEAKAQADAARRHESASGAAVKPGKSEVYQPARGRRRGPPTAET